ncbi:TolC family protein [Sphingobium sufflavum]|uniref:TolC family protein n=1 Tax=Sphingobium sufflavum TaxID=1129547 RepID=UPI001F43354B|nr:TolC family protein [Sphingobium sufflavum]MCE7797128.1 TolC family protein [Sphingobium sufflavum]
MKFSFEGRALRRARRSPGLLRPGLAGSAAVALMLLAAGGQAQSQTQAQSQAQTGALRLDDILTRAATGDPSMAATAAHVEAAEASVRQAGVRPLPGIAVDLENFAGTGQYGPVNMSESTAWYERSWERGGKRAARIDAARADVGVMAERGRIRSLDYLEKVEQAWVEALAAEAAIAGAEEYLRIVSGVLGQVERRVGAAVDPLFAAQRARTDVAQARIARDQAVDAARIARATLARYWGGGEDYRLDLSPFDRLDGVAGPEGETPDLALLAAEREAAERRVRVEEAKSVSDPTVRAGVRHFSQTNDIAVVFGASIPLGAGRANRANVERARAEQGAADAELAVKRIERDREVAILEANRTRLASEIRRIEREVLPSARRVVALVQDGLARGGLAFTYLEASAAQQAVHQARLRRVELLRRFHLDGARIDRLTGRHAPLLIRAENR